MYIKGDLSTTNLPDLLQTLKNMSKEGTLTLTLNEFSKTLRISGKTIRLISIGERKSLKIGEMLVRANKISREQLNTALNQQKLKKKKLGEILVDLGFINNDELKATIQTQIEEELYEIFSWKNGHFEFIDGPISEELTLQEPIFDISFDVDMITLDALRRLDEMQVKLKFIPYPTTHLTLGEKQITTIKLKDKATELIIYYNDPKLSLEQIARKHNLNLSELLSATAELLENGTMRKLEQTELLELADKWEKLGDPDITISILTDLYTEEKKPELAERLGKFYKKINQEDSIKYLQEAIRLYSNQKNFQKVKELFEYCVASFTDKIVFYEQYIDILTREGMKEDIMKLILIGSDIAIKANNLDKAKKWLIFALEIEPLNKTIITLLSKVLILEDNYEKAAELLNRIKPASQEKPISPMVLSQKFKEKDSLTKKLHIVLEGKKEKKIDKPNVRKIILLSSSFFLLFFIGYNLIAFFEFSNLKEKTKTLTKKEVEKIKSSFKKKYPLTIASMMLLNSITEMTISEKSNASGKKVTDNFYIIKNGNKANGQNNNLDSKIDEYEKKLNNIKNDKNLSYDQVFKIFKNMEKDLNVLLKQQTTNEQTIKIESILKRMNSYIVQLAENLLTDIENKVNAGEIEEAWIKTEELIKYFSNTEAIKKAFWHIEISSIPENAEIYINDAYSGKKTNTIIKIDAFSKFSISIKYKGFDDVQLSQEEISSRKGRILVKLNKGREYGEKVSGIIEGLIDADKERVFFTDRAGYLYTYSQDEAREHWKFSTQKSRTGILTGALLENDSIIFGCNAGILYCVKTNGEKKWDFDCKGMIKIPPYILDSNQKSIFVATSDGKVYKLGLDDGNFIWSVETKKDEPVHILVINHILCIFFKKEIICINISDQKDYDKIENALFYVRNRKGYIDYFYYISDRNMLTKYTINDKRREELLEIPVALQSPPIVFEKKIYLACKDRNIYRYDLETKNKDWNYSVEAQDGVRVYIDIDKMVYLTSGRTLVCILDNGKKFWEFNAEGKIRAEVGFSDTYIFVGCEDGYFYSIRK